MNRRCSACRALLPIGRRNRYCMACGREAWLARTRQPERRCSGGCGARLPQGKRYNYCPACMRGVRERLKTKPRLCTGCRDLVPATWSHYRCRDCESMRGVEYRSRKRQERMAA
jgi:hypothetical protein